MESEESLVAYGLEAAEKSQPQIIEQSATVAAEEVSSESEVLEESTRYESTVESTFEVIADPMPEPEMIEEPDYEAIEKIEVGAIEVTETEISAEGESEETLVTYDLEVDEEPRQESVEKQESAFSSLLQSIFAGQETAKVARPTAESIEASKPKVIEESRLNDSAIEEETDSISLCLANIFSGKAELAVPKKPQASTAREVEPDETKAPDSEAGEKPRQKVVKEKKSVFSYLQKIFK